VIRSSCESNFENLLNVASICILDYLKLAVLKIRLAEASETKIHLPIAFS